MFSQLSTGGKGFTKFGPGKFINSGSYWFYAVITKVPRPVLSEHAGMESVLLAKQQHGAMINDIPAI